MRWLPLTSSDIVADAPSTSPNARIEHAGHFQSAKKSPRLKIPDDPRSPDIQSCLQGCALPGNHPAAWWTNSECSTSNFEYLGERGGGLFFFAEPGTRLELVSFLQRCTRARYGWVGALAIRRTDAETTKTCESHRWRWR